MHVEWYGQSAFSLSDGSTTVFIDPFATMTAAADRGIRWDYPAIGDVDADLLLVTHEHLDHNGVEAVGGDPVTLRSVVGHLESPVGEVLGVASEHDEVAGTDRGVNTMFVFHLAGRRVAHLGDLGQRALREEQLAALGSVDLLFVPVGGGPTIGASRPRRSRPPWARASSCRCTTRPSASTSFSPWTSSSARGPRRATGLARVRPECAPGRRNPRGDRASGALTDNAGMIEIDHVTKRYGEKVAVHDLTFSVQPGVVTGFLGPNGAGKSPRCA